MAYTSNSSPLWLILVTYGTNSPHLWWSFLVCELNHADVGWITFPKMLSSLLIPVNVTLFQNRVFVDVQVKIISLGWAVFQWLCPYKKGNLDTKTQRKGDRKTQGEFYLQAKECLRIPEARRGWDRISLTVLRGTSPSKSLIWGPAQQWNNKFPLFQSPNLWYFLTEAPGN